MAEFLLGGSPSFRYSGTSHVSYEAFIESSEARGMEQDVGSLFRDIMTSCYRQKICRVNTLVPNVVERICGGEQESIH